MLKNISLLNGTQMLSKSLQAKIYGGASSCIINCRQNFADCREDRGPNCSADLAACRAAC